MVSFSKAGVESPIARHGLDWKCFPSRARTMSVPSHRTYCVSAKTARVSDPNHRGDSCLSFQPSSTLHLGLPSDRSSAVSRPS
ncbi:MAG: hypothetical protein ACE15C_13265 [Phycisphaerae bacterium]